MFSIVTILLAMFIFQVFLWLGNINKLFWGAWPPSTLGLLSFYLGNANDINEALLCFASMYIVCLHASSKGIIFKYYHIFPNMTMKSIDVLSHNFFLYLLMPSGMHFFLNYDVSLNSLSWPFYEIAWLELILFLTSHWIEWSPNTSCELLPILH